MSAELEKKLIEILNSGNIEKGLSELSLNEKVLLVKSNSYLKKLLLEHVSPSYTLINEEESIYIYQNYNPNDFNILDFYFLQFIKFSSFFDDIFCQKYYETKDEVYVSLIKDPEKQWRFIDSLDYAFSDYSVLSDTVLEKMLFDKRWKAERSSISIYFKDDSYREKYFDRFDLNFKINTISYFKSEELKEKYLKYIPVSKRGLIISSFSNDELKKKCLTGFTSDKGYIISSFDSDETKIEYLDHYRLVLSQNEKGRIIASLKSKDNIMKYLRLLKKEQGIVGFLQHFDKNRDSELCNKLIGLINNESNLREVWYSVHYNNIELALLILDKIKNKKILREMLEFNHNKSIIKSILLKLDTYSVNKYIKDHMELIEFDILLCCKDENIIIETLKHNTIEENINTQYSEKLRPLFEIASRHYNCNLDHLIRLAKKSSCYILNNLENDNIIDAVNLNEEDFEKYLKLFDDKNMDINMNSVSTIATIALQIKFGFDNPDEINIFSNIIHGIDSGKKDEAIKMIKYVCSFVDITKYKINDIDSFVNKIIMEVETKNTRSKKGDKEKTKTEIFNQITYEFLKLKRNEYARNNISSVLEDCTDVKYEKNSLIKYIFKYIPEEMIKSFFILDDETESKVNEDMMNLINNEELLLDLIRFKKNSFKDGPIKEEIRRNLKLFNELCGIVFNIPYDSFDKIDNISREFIVKDVNKSSLVDIMSNIDTKKVRDLIFSNNSLYFELLEYLDKYDMMGWDDRFSELSNQADLDFNYNMVSAVINFYTQIVKEREKAKSKNESFSFLSELKLADSLDSQSDIFSIIIGQDDYKYIRRNPRPNASPKNKRYRINAASEFMKKMHKKKFNSVPSIDEDVTLKSGKSINIMVGNTNDLINLTYGERTGACMRIGGAGESLFEFCLTNENGFHVSFNDPKTGELVSRVSCFRNGNTLFLNQLRYSLNDKYENKDIIEACKIFSKKMIELTRNSKYPIENVIASNGYALEHESIVNINCDDIQKGLPDFYSDIGEYAVIMASTTEPFTPIKTGPSSVEKYPIIRSKVKKYEGKRANAAIKHIEGVDLFYSGYEPENINIENRKVEVAFVGEDWYVARLIDGQIISYIEENSLNKLEAKRELDIYMQTLQSTKTYGGMDL